MKRRLYCEILLTLHPNMLTARYALSRRTACHAQGLCRSATESGVEHLGPHAHTVAPHQLADRVGKGQYDSHPQRPRVV